MNFPSQAALVTAPEAATNEHLQFGCEYYFSFICFLFFDVLELGLIVLRSF